MSNNHSLLRAWTYASAPSSGAYWRTGGVNVILLEYTDGQLEWRRVDDGVVVYTVTPPVSYHKGKPLPLEYHPQWLRDIDDYGVDEGL